MRYSLTFILALFGTFVQANPGIFSSRIFELEIEYQDGQTLVLDTFYFHTSDEVTIPQRGTETESWIHLLSLAHRDAVKREQSNKMYFPLPSRWVAFSPWLCPQGVEDTIRLGGYNYLTDIVNIDSAGVKRIHSIQSFTESALDGIFFLNEDYINTCVDTILSIQVPISISNFNRPSDITEIVDSYQILLYDRYESVDSLIYHMKALESVMIHATQIYSESLYYADDVDSFFTGSPKEDIGEVFHPAWQFYSGYESMMMSLLALLQEEGNCAIIWHSGF